MDLRISSIGLLLDGLSFLSPIGLAMLGFAWYSNESIVAQAFLVSVGLLLALVGVIRRGTLSVSHLEVLILACGCLVFLAMYDLVSVTMASTPFGDRCAEIGDPLACSIMNNAKLLELLFWPAILTAALTLVGTVLALRQVAHGTSRLSSEPTGLTDIVYATAVAPAVEENTRLRNLPNGKH
jgi:hypothetical protein